MKKTEVIALVQSLVKSELLGLFNLFPEQFINTLKN